MSIAFDSASTGYQNGNSTPVTNSHTVAAGATLLLAAVYLDNPSDLLDTVVWNDTEALSLIAVTHGGATGVYTYLYGLLNPTSGTHDLVASKESVCSMVLIGASYTGTRNDSLPTITEVASLTDSSAGSISKTITTIVEGSWVAGAGFNNFANGMSIDGDHTIRAGVVAIDNYSRGWADSNAAIDPPGDDTMTWTKSGTGDWGIIVCVIEPYSAPASNIKSINGLAKASIKSINGLAIASVKSFNGLS